MARSVRLSADEAWEVVAGAHTGILTTLRRDGSPIALPVWFVTMDRCVYVTGPSQTKKFARLRHDPRVSFLVESGTRWAELRAVHMSGTAAFVDDASLVGRVARAFDRKYAAYRTPRGDMPAPTRAHYDTGQTTVEITFADRILSWDNARLFSEGPA